ncbi:uncharacterized protein [Macrobrachium rosenbergii]|uniref:uncharacterized protein n=1 Tax=Macrobrachium rosenbergii TaxID=79674 RepID=UPI0034D3FE79
MGNPIRNPCVRTVREQGTRVPFMWHFPKSNVQWPPPPRSISDPIPVPGPAPVPVPGPQVDTPPGDPTLDSQSLPVSLGCTEQCPAPSFPNDEQIPNQLLVPGPTLVPVPEHNPDLHSRDPSPGHLSSPGLAPLPMLVRETDPSDRSRSSPKGAASQPMPELVILTCKPLTPTTTTSSLSQPLADATVSKDSTMSQMANKLKELRRIMVELAKKAPASAVKGADTGGTQIPFPGSVPPIPRPRRTITVREVRGGHAPGVDNSR